MTSLLPHPVDQHVGWLIRLRRKALGISQQRLAEAVGLTFQQVQKYERAANRISASKLYDIAAVLEAPVESFYAGLAPTGEPGAGAMSPAAQALAALPKRSISPSPWPVSAASSEGWWWPLRRRSPLRRLRQSDLGLRRRR